MDNTVKEYIGNVALLNLPHIAFLSSQQATPEAQAKVLEWAKVQAKKSDCIISGFQSKLERDVLNILLEGNARIILVLAEKLFDRCPEKYKQAVDDNRMLIFSPVKSEGKFVNKQNAMLRNKYILNNTGKVVVGSLTKGGMLDGLLKGRKYILLGD